MHLICFQSLIVLSMDIYQGQSGLIALLKGLHFDLPPMHEFKSKNEMFLYSHHSIFALLLQIAVTLSISHQIYIY